jgi:hypothetical protein
VRSNVFIVDKPGTHTVSLWMNQDGVAVDKLLITTDETLKPSDELEPASGVPMGVGPAETATRNR